MADRDRIRRFVFENSPLRGHILHLDSSWQAMCEHHEYPPAVRGVLGEAAVAAALIASTRKFDGTLTLQLQGPGPMHLLVAQCSHGFGLRGVARWTAQVPQSDLREMAGDGKLTVSVETADLAARYQGVVPLASGGLAACLEAYFRDSEQLPTRIWLAANSQSAAGLLLQRLPEWRSKPSLVIRDEQDPAEAWNRIDQLASTLTEAELLELPQRELLRRLFHQEDVRLFEPAPVYFRCRCSRERVRGILKSLGQEEIRSIVAERGAVEVRCEFCNRAYRFDAVDSEQIFHPGPESPTNTLQ